MTVRQATEHDLPGDGRDLRRAGTDRDLDLRPRTPAAVVLGARLASDEPGDHVLVDEEAGEVVGFAYSSATARGPATG